MKCLSLYIDLRYSIEYATRKSENGNIGSKELLDNINTIDLNASSSNIDELFIKKAYSIIQDWFAGEKSRMNRFAGKLQNYVTIIWYEVDSNEDSIGIFTRLNIGKINLTNAELVKALFLNRGKKDDQGMYAGNPYGIDNKTQHEIALQWDAMEKGLHDSKFWAFITNEKRINTQFVWSCSSTLWRINLLMNVTILPLTNSVKSSRRVQISQRHGKPL